MVGQTGNRLGAGGAVGGAAVGVGAVGVAVGRLGVGVAAGRVTVGVAAPGVVAAGMHSDCPTRIRLGSARLLACAICCKGTGVNPSAIVNRVSTVLTT